MKRIFFSTLALVFAVSSLLYAEESIQSLEKGLSYKTGKITIGDDIATLNLGSGFKYLNPKDTKIVLEKIWGNPEGTGDDTLGLIFPAEGSASSNSSWGIVITFEDSGYVKDDEAEKINYNDLLKTMKENVTKSSEERVKSGYPSIELVGWAASPTYDKTTHKLFWAKELKFGGSKENTLNYNFRILGRKGVLILNAVASMAQLKDIEKRSPQILSAVEFTDGNRYADFNPKTDKLAEFGIAALVAGGAAAAAKAGFLKGLWVAILAAKKFIFIGLIAAGAFLAKYFKRLFARKPTEENKPE